MNNSTPTQQVKNPRLMLFAFQLRNDITTGVKQPVKDADKLWYRCEEIGHKINSDKLKSLKSKLIYPDEETKHSIEYLELLKPEKSTPDKCIKFTTANFLAGELKSVRIHDIYAIDLTFHEAKPELLEVARLAELNPDGCLLPKQIQATIGQTLLLFVSPVDILTDYKVLAENCVNALIPDDYTPKPKLLTEGRLFGSPIFEFDIILDNLSNLSDRCHILVFFNAHPATQNIVEKAYHSLFFLLSYRSKILYAYHSSRECDKEAKELYSYLDGKIQELDKLPTDIELKLHKLTELLIEMPQKIFQYSCQLRNLKNHKNMLKTNANNYEIWLDKINFLCIEEDNTKLLQDFLTRTRNQFHTQIEVDLNYLTPGQELFQQLISTIRGIVEIEQARIAQKSEKDLQEKEAAQAERDRKIEETIQAVGAGIGAGLGAGGIFASSFTLITPSNPIQLDFKSTSIHPFTLSLVLSLFFGLTVGWVTWWVTRLIQRRYTDVKSK